MSDLKLYMVHTGFYDNETGFGAYENHTNFFVTATSAADAKAKVKAMPIYKAKKMHTDSIQMIDAVDGFRVHLEADKNLDGHSKIVAQSYEDINPST